MATIADVAERAGVSIATVSRVLSPDAARHAVRPATAERVQLVARQLGYVASPLARGLAAGRSGLIGLLVPDLTDPHYPPIARGVEDAARETGLAVLMCNTLGDPQRLFEYVQLLIARKADAVVLSGTSALGGQTLKRLAESDVPIVLVGRPPKGVSLVHVSTDNELAARQATAHLIEKGARLVLHVAGPTAQTTMADRAQGYRRAMDDAGLESEVLGTLGTPEDGYRQVHMQLRKRSPRPRAIFAATDRLAIAALAAASDLGITVPRELSLMGFDDIPLADQLRPRLSSVAQPAQEMGRRAIELARRMAAGETVEPVTLEARLVLRESTGD